MKLELGITIADPEISQAEVDQLLSVLTALSENPPAAEPGKKPRQPGWFTAIEIAAAIGEGMNDRDVRKIAKAARPAIVSFPGSPGYKLWQQCTIEEISHCIEAMESQARDMNKDAMIYRQAFHKRFRGATPIA